MFHLALHILFPQLMLFGATNSDGGHTFIVHLAEWNFQQNNPIGRTDSTGRSIVDRQEGHRVLARWYGISNKNARINIILYGTTEYYNEDLPLNIIYYSLNVQIRPQDWLSNEYSPIEFFRRVNNPSQLNITLYNIDPRLFVTLLTQ